MNVNQNKTTEKVSEVSLADKLVEAREPNLTEFGGIEHRLELVSTIEGVSYINDSKATDVNSTWYSLDTVNSPLVWIVGVSDSETDYSVFNDLVREKVKAIVFLGENQEGVLDTILKQVDNSASAQSVQEAVQLAKSFAVNGDVVLLSPASSSYHVFQSYKDRGEQFKKAVSEL